ncbi:GH36-type glycosyl hydrolase domain-containing protein [Microbaculum marinisediminis]|uniref:Cellobiose phosphorylase n=1 Tax=Microbaculum marinisediminis TaxID=2931392 RepID=A0AAW5QWQ7_9HYPH|nr:glucoamylase family protein [Microbaculum sp. A6E488]MCT8971440.1 cellobiose phosphorylase [Microbaculum sp. A6E488]
MNDWEEEIPIDPLAAAAHEIGARHAISKLKPDRIAALSRIDQMSGWLTRARAAAAHPPPEATKAAEWLLDNDYQIQRAIVQIEHDLPPRFYERLARLEGGTDDGLPRIYATAHEFLRASHLQVSLSAAVRFVQAYQESASLTIAELWAFPTMLRLACLEFMACGCQRLFPGLDPPFAPTPHAASCPEFEDTECVARALANLGVIAAIPWKDFFDRTSLVEAVLASDPAGIYSRMAFETRDAYRKAVEEIASAAKRSETEVADCVIGGAGTAGAAPPRDHVGYWLVGDGRRDLERLVEFHASWKAACVRELARQTGPLYAAAIATASLAALLVPAMYLAAAGAGPGAWFIGVGIVLLPASVLGITAVHWIVTLLVPPRVLPKLDFQARIPADCNTAVVVPVIIRAATEVPRLIQRLERHRLANPDPSLRFIILSDHADAPAEHMPGDDEIEGALLDGIRQLNSRYGGSTRQPFHLLHRPRRYNPSEDCWMGWERKRGKLEEFNLLLLGGDGRGFSLHEGDRNALNRIRFVVTVDADTILSPGSVNRLVGTMAHPLNTAQFDERSGRVSAGYTVIQPRVEISPESGNRSLFARLYAGNTAIDIYSRAVSDVYQDLFGSGIFVGKGIYEVGPFQRSFDGRIPENALVSHDLFEGINGRAALASDIVLYEDFPTSYVEYARRWHRWVRGDWQLLPWLGIRVPGPGGERLGNRHSILDRWKIVDNLRRSLVPPALVTLAAAGWLALPGSPWVWTAFTVAAPGAYLFTDLVTGLARGRRRGAARRMLHQLLDHSGRWLLAIVFLAQDAAVAVDAIARTLWRLLVSRRHLLEWVSTAHTAAANDGRNSLTARWFQMWQAPTLSVTLGGAVALAHPSALLPAACLLLPWFVSPEIAAWFSRPRLPRKEELGASDLTYLRRLARRTWLYFETFVGPGDNWLPPDNVQEEPHAAIAHRTSPTNIGMMFLSSLAAWDLGYVSSTDFAARVHNALDSLDRLERHRGHFLNWYDTQRLEPLEPHYVSTVDSGNLAVCLLAMKEGCREALSAPAMRHEQWDGLADTLDLLVEAVKRIPDTETHELLQVRVAAISAHIDSARRDVSATWPILAELRQQAFTDLESIVGRAIALPGPPPEGTLRDIQIWLERARHHLVRMQQDLELLAPWLPLLEAPPPDCKRLAREIGEKVNTSAPMGKIVQRCATARELVAAVAGSGPDTATTQWLIELDAALEQGARSQAELADELLNSARRLETLAFAMDFRMLFDDETRLFHIGYNVSSDRIDTSHYDLLASEARLASFFAIAKGDVPFEHWFFLGRPITRTSDGLTLVSWNGSMFEYLMPALLLRSEPDTLIAESERTAVDAQRRFAEERGVPWGTSESAFASRDSSHHYRYRGFGVPELGLRRGLSLDIVVAPYATALALTAHTKAAVDNLRELDRLGLTGSYGLFEAADFTPERIPAGTRFSPVRAYMAHHQGMMLSALDNVLRGDILVHRFHRDPRVRAVELLLQERVPRELPPEIRALEERDAPLMRRSAIPAPHAWIPAPDATFPQIHTLGNGRLASWISEAGGGGLSWHGHALTRFLPDPTRDACGLWVYVRDETDGAIWSIGRQPTGITADEYHVVFHPHMAELQRRDHGIGQRMEVGVVPGDDLEIRRISVVNESDRRRSLRITSFGEVVLAPPLEDERHPAFSKLFVGSEYLSELDGLLFTRRSRNPGEAPPVLLHRVVADDAGVEVTGFETDRRRFLGRKGSAHEPRAVREGLSGTTGWTLDSVMAIEVRIVLEPQDRRQFAFLTIVAGSRESVLAIAERYATLASLDWALADAASDVAREAQELRIEPARLPELQSLASLLLYRHPALRGRPDAVAENRLGQPRLWGLGISGDLPVLALRVADPKETDLLRALIAGHELWRRRGIHVDLVILRGGASGYVEPLRESLLSLLQEAGSQELLGHRGGIHLVLGDQIGDEDRCLIEATACVILDTSQGTIEHQLTSASVPHSLPPRFEPTRRVPLVEDSPKLPRRLDLAFDNGFGGFTADGREYVIHLEPGETTPAPWSNVLANERFGTIITESGGGFTWALNSGENRLTPWTNDPVADPPVEALYLRDEETAEIWTPTPGPAGDGAACEIRHGAGYTVWQHVSHRLEQKLLVFVPPDDPVKIARLTLHNLESRPRRITATYYAEWLLGALTSARPFVVCEYDAARHALLARNPWNPDFAERVAFLTSNHPPHSLTTDRQDFLGREGAMGAPEGLMRWDLGGRVEAGADACAAFQVHIDIDAGATSDIVFVLGQGDNRSHTDELVRRWQDLGHVDRAFDACNHFWDERLGAVHVETPDSAFNLMVNRWFLYQTLASRLFARAGFYQAGGAIGFRDQLQDVLAILHADPKRARAHILTVAARQFEEGDVLHWWHPPYNRGVRTRCSDDLLWLPYVTGCYVEATGDESILHETVPFLRAPPLAPDEEDRYARFDTISEPRPLFEHCERALERGLTPGSHGLPLIGAGDWNDGMNRVGAAGRGESVWLAWFAIATIRQFTALAQRMKRNDLAEHWLTRISELQKAVAKSAWDGKWYLRAFDDDGHPLGSADSDECRIDSVAQSWAVLSADRVSERARTAVDSADHELLRKDERLIRLLWPPFDATPHDPGYIKAYPPGIRENGGQYSHAAAWLGHAFARLGDGERAMQVFNILNPIRHAITRSDVERYRVEPYALAADVSSVAPNIGCGGWTWYTGAAGWTWRLAVEATLGLRLQEGRLMIDPCLPKGWDFFKVEVKGPAGNLAVRFEDPDQIGRGLVEIFVDGEVHPNGPVAFPTDGSTRQVTARLCRKPAQTATS